MLRVLAAGGAFIGKRQLASTQGAEHVFAALLERVPAAWAPAQGFLETLRSRITADTIGLAERVQRARCGLTGHAMVLHVQPQRISLRCMDCGEQTPGWTIRARD